MKAEMIRIQTRLSELRETINADGDAADVSALMRESRDLEVKFRAALAVEEQPVDQDAGESRERSGLAERVQLRQYLAAAAGETRLSGAEEELRQADGLGENVIPWAALLPVEERADVSTPAPTTVDTSMHGVLGRVFARSAASFLGTSFPSVPAGQHSYPVLSTGHDAAFVGEAATHDSTAGAFVVTTLTPRRLVARVSWSVEDAAVFGQLESALRDDLRGAVSERLDEEIVAGDGVSPNLGGFLGSGLTAPSDPTAQATYNSYRDGVTALVDGRYASTPAAVRLLWGAATYSHAAGVYHEADAASEFLARVTGGLRVSAHVPATSNKFQDAVARIGTGSAVAPMWGGGLTAVRDVFSGAATGTVSLTLTALYAFSIRRTADYARLRFQVQA